MCSFIVNIFNFIHARKVNNEFSTLITEECYGCQTVHPSQTHHTCLMCSKEELLCMYYDKARSRVDIKDILLCWKRELSYLDLSDKAIADYVLLFEKNDWRKEHCANNDKLFEMVEKIMHLEKRLGDATL